MAMTHMNYWVPISFSSWMCCVQENQFIYFPVPAPAFPLPFLLALAAAVSGEEDPVPGEEDGVISGKLDLT